MKPFLERLGFRRQGSDKQEKIVEDLASISKITDDIGHKVEEVNAIEIDMLLEKKDEYFLSLNDFMKIIDLEDWRFSDIVSKFVHLSDLNSSLFSVVNMSAISEEGHIVLCPDPKTCRKHRKYKGDTLSIASLRRNTRVR